MAFVVVSVVVAVLGGVAIAWFAARRSARGSGYLAIAILVFGLLMVFVSTMIEQTELGNWPAVTRSYRSGEQWCVHYVPPSEEGPARIECRPSETEAWEWADQYTSELERTYGPSTRTPEGWALLIGLYGWALVGVAGIVFVLPRLRTRRRSPESESGR
jgi:hypothetical protein